MLQFDRQSRSFLLFACWLSLCVAATHAQEAAYESYSIQDSYSSPSIAAFADASCGCCDSGSGFGCLGSCNGGGDATNIVDNVCPTPKPCLESVPGRSLYWQDNCNGGYRHEEPLFHDSRRGRLYASFESIAFFRDQKRTANFLPLVAGGLTDFGRDFETEFDHSMRGVIGFALSDWYRLDFTWINEFEWSDRLAAANGNQSETIDFHTRLKTGEINLRRRVRIRDWPQHYPDYWNSFELSTIIGYRFLELSEEINYLPQAPAATGSATTRTDNQMSGVQIGAQAQWLYEDRGWTDFEVKGAILSNDLSVVSSPASFQGDESRTAFLVDASLIFNYQFTPSFTMRLGYNMMWVAGTALASENISDASVPSLPPAHDGETFFHGPSIGLMYVR